MTKFCSRCGHKWDLHYQVKPTLKGKFEIKMVCAGVAFPCYCVREYFENPPIEDDHKKWLYQEFGNDILNNTLDQKDNSK